MPPSGALAPEARHVLVHKLREPVEAPSVSTRPTAPGPTDPFAGAQTPRRVPRTFSSDALPRKRILTQRHLDHYSPTTAFAEILGIIRTCNAAIKGKKLNENDEESVPIKGFVPIVALVRT